MYLLIWKISANTERGYTTETQRTEVQESRSYRSQKADEEQIRSLDMDRADHEKELKND